MQQNELAKNSVKIKLLLRWAILPEFENLPTDWSLIPLIAVVKLIAGQSPSSEYYNNKGEGLPFLQGNADFSDRFPSPSIWCSKPSKTCNVGATLISVRAPVGEINRADTNYALGRGIAALEAFGVDPDFLYHGMARWRKPLQRISQGTTFDAVTARHFNKVIVPLPKKHLEQKNIAQILDSVDTVIEHTRTAITRAQQLKSGLTGSLLSCGIDDTGIYRNPSLKTSDFIKTRFGHFPKSWQIQAIREVGDVGSGVTLGKKVDGFATTDLPYLRVANVQDGHLDLKEIKNVRVKAEEVERYLLQPGDVLMTEGGDFDKLGRGTVWEGQISPCLHQNHIFRVRLDQTKVDPFYLSAVIGSEYGKRYFMRIAKRTTNLASINKTQLRAFHFPIPPLTEQKRIVNILGKTDSYICPLNKSLENLEQLKKGLMQDLLTGKVRVRNVESFNPPSSLK